jgi:hypothetical protein
LRNVGSNKLFGGPIQAKIIIATIDEDYDLIIKDNDDRSSIAYFTPKYLGKYNKIKVMDIKKLAHKAIKRKLKTQFMALNLVDK